MHPAVIERLIDEIERLQNNKIEVIFIESALIFELGLDEGFDYVVSVTASNKNRINRIKTRSGLTDAQIVRRMKQQLSQEEKNKNSDFVIENDKDMKALESSVNFLMPIILTLPNKDDSNEYDGED
ncbi:Dephospho-CoA kinase [bioreactor metagenome]|uniref:Dephospho-CoA kinase n=1 Tax=bioreactor metagenome TaxID=1076179 RepID=A0A645FEP7_9ZZZZ